MDSANAPANCAALLQVSGRVHAQALEQFGAPLYVADRAGLLLWINAKAKALHGDVVGRPITSVVAPEQISYAHHQFARKVTGQVVATDYDLTLLDGAGTRVAARVHSVSLEPNDAGAAVFGAAIPVIAELEHDASYTDDQAAVVHLTGRQHETLLLLGDGLGTSEIAAQLGISVDTARNHIRAVMNALGAHSRLESVAIAHRIGLLPPRR